MNYNLYNKNEAFYNIIAEVSNALIRTYNLNSSLTHFYIIENKEQLFYLIKSLRN